MCRFLAVVSLLAFAVMARAQVQPPPSADLKITLIPQNYKVWCWAATAQMIMAKYGVLIEQCDQVSNQPLGHSPCCVQSPPQSCLHSGEPEFERWGFTTAMENSTSGLDTDTIMREVGIEGRPLAYARRPVGNPPNDLGHIMVISGYDANFGLTFYVRDPQGEISGVTPEQYVGGIPNYAYEHARTYYNIRRKP